MKFQIGELVRLSAPIANNLLSVVIDAHVLEQDQESYEIVPLCYSQSNQRPHSATMIEFAEGELGLSFVAECGMARSVPVNCLIKEQDGRSLSAANVEIINTKVKRFLAG
jgi:ethanolamine utilization protein EutQ (cupin superfamily)